MSIFFFFFKNFHCFFFFFCQEVLEIILSILVLGLLMSVRVAECGQEVWTKLIVPLGKWLTRSFNLTSHFTLYIPIYYCTTFTFMSLL
ncbi:hypothetical protein PVL29_000957 [Vitis rotundifolia]|uniref:Uncharacterized protein n=1 Tax=Vitis rotundifolia TaxID=103349 RepID=A0AA39ALK5_VITRO|nr:hypothetical protein PVL29_000957 [Vitis rotundifolia]